ncbi:MAG: type II toxin-antitoxin system HicA family toxin [Actinomycetota bacterium]
MPPLPALSGVQLIKILEAKGFQQVRQSGSHVRLRHPDGRATTIPVHGGRSLGKGLLRAILRQIDLGFEELKSKP